MRYFYWGGSDSGKNHLTYYSRINNKTCLMWCDYFIRKDKTITHIYEPYKWSEETKRVWIYHYNVGLKEKYKEFRQILNEDPKNKNFYRNVFRSNCRHKSQINPVKNKTVNKLSLSDEDIKKYSDVKYIDTEIYDEILLKHRGKAFPLLTHEKLDGHWEKIFEGVDCMFIGCEPKDWMIDDLTPFLREGISIVPYKSNNLDNYISKLDGFQDFRPNINISNSNLFETYEKDKQLVWKFLNSWNEEIENIASILKDKKIPFIYFDLDKDRYEDIFKGWDNNLPKNYTHRQQFWQEDNTEYEKRYSKVKAIAEEYIDNSPTVTYNI